MSRIQLNDGSGTVVSTDPCPAPCARVTPLVIMYCDCTGTDVHRCEIAHTPSLFRSAIARATGPDLTGNRRFGRAAFACHCFATRSHQPAARDVTGLIPERKDIRGEVGRLGPRPRLPAPNGVARRAPARCDALARRGVGGARRAGKQRHAREEARSEPDRDPRHVNHHRQGPINSIMRALAATGRAKRFVALP